MHGLLTRGLPVSLSVCLAVVALGPMAHAQSFVDVTAGSGLPAIPGSLVEYGCGLACGDFDGDGDLDLVVPGNPNQPFRYFRNNGNATFSDQTAGAGLGTHGTAHGTAVADVDNDGDKDLFVAMWNGPSLLFINDGTGVFTEQAASRGIRHNRSSFSCNFGDYDRDGWLDLYVGNHGIAEPNILYRNTGGGQFVDVTAQAGVASTGATFASAFMDYDEDGWPDLVVVNDLGAVLGPNDLLRNNRDGTFSSTAASAGAAVAMNGMSVDYGDVFNDGGVDFFASDTPSDHLFMRWEDSLNRYVDDTYTYGLQGGLLGWGSNFLDFNNDGWQDLYVVHELGPNHMYANPGQPAATQALWSEVAPSLQLATWFHQYCALIADLDNDGALDIVHRYQARAVGPQPANGISLHRNHATAGRHWLKIALRGTASNRDGIGARVVVRAGNRTQRQWARSGTGFQTSSDPRLHFGLGSTTIVDRVTVVWPSGQVQQLDSVAVDQILEVVEPRFALRAPARVGATTHFDLAVQGDEFFTYAMALAHATAPRTVLPGGTVLPIAVDGLTADSLTAGNTILPASLGTLDAAGQASSALHIPNNPALLGFTVFATAVTLNPSGVPIVRTAFPTAVPVAIQ